jgi:hypothetical protein
MREDVRSGRYTDGSALADAYDVDPSYARKIIRSVRGAGK